MAINLGNVNISLRQFQEISSGKYNAGEVKLTSETEIDKVNNHVTMKFLNTTKISHEEVLAIKNAFVKALKGSGVDTNELNRIREELGLAPTKPVDRILHERSIKPLSRQQIREILDRNAAAINDREGAGTIRTSQEIHANVSERTQASRAAEREAVNAELNTRRDIVENKVINNIQAVLAGDVDFATPDERDEILSTARRCLDTVLVGCNGSPRDNVKASLQWTASGGKNVILSSGITEKALVRKLEDIIVRLAISKAPSEEELTFRDEFKALATPEERATWAENLANDPNGAYKARVVAVMIMHDRGICDAETLSIVNQLKKDDSIAFVTNLVSNAMNLEGEALRASEPVQTAMASVDAHANVNKFERAYIPALTDNEFNCQISFNMENHPERLPATFSRLVDDATSEVRTRFGTFAYPHKITPKLLVRGNNLAVIIGAKNPNAPRVTAESLRAPYIDEARHAGAEAVLRNGIEKRLKAVGMNLPNVSRVASALQERVPGLLEPIIAAPSPEEADAVLDNYTDKMTESARLLSIAERCHKSLKGWTMEALAGKLGVSVQSLANTSLNFDHLVSEGGSLKGAICKREIAVSTDAEIEAEFKKLADKFANERMQLFDKVDKADITAEAKVAIKSTVFALAKVNYLDLDNMITAAKSISPGKLADLLANNAPKDQVFDAMREISDAISAVTTQALDKIPGCGKDEEFGYKSVMIALVVLSKPEMEGNLVKFLAQNVVGRDYTDAKDISHPAMTFMHEFSPDTAANGALASKLGTDKFPALHTLALMEAVREEGLGELTAAETLALFKPGQPTGGTLLKTAIINSDRPITAPLLKKFARTALQTCKPTILEIRQNKVAVENAERQFLAGNGATRAREAGYHASELPKLAKAFALYKVATNCTDDVALDAVLAPASKASRLMNYGGRFTESAESFRAGLALMDKFSQWYANVAQAVKDGKLDTPTQVNATKDYMPAEALRGYEMFVFQDLAIRPDVNLDADPETLFGIEHNNAVNFFSRGNGSGCTGMLMRLPPAKRQVVYAAFKAIEAPKPENPGKELTSVNNAPWYLARILRNYDQVADLAANGNLDRTHLNKILAPDLDLPDDATSQQVNDIIQNRLFEKYGESPDKFSVASEYVRNGYTITEIVDAVDNGRKLDRLPEMSPTEMKIEAIDGTTRGGRELMLVDLCRPMQLSYAGSDIKIPPVENNYFTVIIGDETIRCATGGQQSNANVAEKIEAFCGTVHIEQANSVMRGLSQAAHLALTPILAQYGISTRQSEHMALTYTLTKNDETGAVTIRYSEPAGFPFKFSWETTVALDGTSTTTPIVFANS